MARRHLAHNNGLPAYLAAIFTLFLISCLVRLATAGAGVDKVEDDGPVILLESSTGPKNKEWSNLEGTNVIVNHHGSCNLYHYLLVQNGVAIFLASQ